MRQPGRSQLEGERDAVEAATDQRHGLGRGRVEDEAGPRGAGPLDEQLDGLQLCEPGRVGVSTRCGQLQRRHPPGQLTRHPERLATGGEHGDAGATGQQRGGQRGGRRHQVLAVVQHHEHALGV